MMLAYDCEIIKGIPPRYGNREPGIEYCAGWRDFENMGISVIGAYDWNTERYRVFMRDNFDEFQDLVESHDGIVSFNGVQFDDKLCAANGIKVTSTCDVLRMAWVANGLDPDVFNPATHGGFGLDAMAKANGLTGKTGHGALAPVQWQQGEYGKVVDYCLEDVRLLVTLVDMMVKCGNLCSPKGNYRMLMRIPDEFLVEYVDED